MTHRIVAFGRCSCDWVYPVAEVRGIDAFSAALTIGAAAELHVLMSAVFDRVLNPGGRS